LCLTEKGKNDWGGGEERNFSPGKTSRDRGQGEKQEYTIRDGLRRRKERGVIGQLRVSKENKEAEQNHRTRGNAEASLEQSADGGTERVRLLGRCKLLSEERGGDGKGSQNESTRDSGVRIRKRGGKWEKGLLRWAHMRGAPGRRQSPGKGGGYTEKRKKRGQKITGKREKWGGQGTRGDDSKTHHGRDRSSYYLGSEEETNCGPEGPQEEGSAAGGRKQSRKGENELRKNNRQKKKKGRGNKLILDTSAKLQKRWAATVGRLQPAKGDGFHRLDKKVSSEGRFPHRGGRGGGE